LQDGKEAGGHAVAFARSAGHVGVAGVVTAAGVGAQIANGSTFHPREVSGVLIPGALEAGAVRCGWLDGAAFLGLPQFARCDADVPPVAAESIVVAEPAALALALRRAIFTAILALTVFLALTGTVVLYVHRRCYRTRVLGCVLYVIVALVVVIGLGCIQALLGHSTVRRPAILALTVFLALTATVVLCVPREYFRTRVVGWVRFVFGAFVPSKGLDYILALPGVTCEFTIIHSLAKLICLTLVTVPSFFTRFHEFTADCVIAANQSRGSALVQIIDVLHEVAR
jgi:hypothetical protein